MSKRQRDLIAEIESLGFGYDHTNSKGVSFYTHEDTGCQVKVPTGCDERAARVVLQTARRSLGLPTKDNKRNPAQIRERNAAEHARAALELAQARTDLEVVRSGLDEQRVRAAEAAFLNADRKFRYWDRLMRSVA
jgi:hypothetical protein